MNLYRAIYATRQQHVRRMTFAARDYVEAQQVAEAWELADDSLQRVVPLRRLTEQSEFSLTH